MMKNITRLSDQGKIDATEWLESVLKADLNETPNQLPSALQWMLDQATNNWDGVHDCEAELRSFETKSGRVETYLFSEKDFIFEEA